MLEMLKSLHASNNLQVYPSLKKRQKGKFHLPQFVFSQTFCLGFNRSMNLFVIFQTEFVVRAILAIIIEAIIVTVQ
jgi:hypothetical protein